MIESQVRYVLAMLHAMREHGAAEAEVRRDAQDAYNRWLQRRMQDTVWLRGGCDSWYLDAGGVNRTLYPGLSSAFRRSLREFRLDEHVLTPARGRRPLPPSPPPRPGSRSRSRHDPRRRPPSRPLIGEAPPSPAGPRPDGVGGLRTVPGIDLPRARCRRCASASARSSSSSARGASSARCSGCAAWSAASPWSPRHPDHVRSLFTAKPELAPSLTGESPLRPIVGPNSVLTAIGAAAHAPAQAAAAALPRRGDRSATRR